MEQVINKTSAKHTLRTIALVCGMQPELSWSLKLINSLDRGGGREK